MEDPKRLEEGSVHDQTVAVERPKATIMAEPTNDQTTKEICDQPNGGEKTMVKQKSKRVATLDAFRGLTIVVSTN